MSDNPTKRDRSAFAKARAYRRTNEREGARARARAMTVTAEQRAAEARVIARRDAWVAAGRPNIDPNSLMLRATTTEATDAPA